MLLFTYPYQIAGHEVAELDGVATIERDGSMTVELLDIGATPQKYFEVFGDVAADIERHVRLKYGEDVYEEMQAARAA